MAADRMNLNRVMPAQGKELDLAGASGLKTLTSVSTS